MQFHCQTSNFKCQMSKDKNQMTKVKCKISKVTNQISNFKCQISKTRVVHRLYTDDVQYLFNMVAFERIMKILNVDILGQYIAEAIFINAFTSSELP